MKRSFAIMVRVDERLKQATEQAAMDDQRSVASLIQKLIVDYLTETGYIDGKRRLGANKVQKTIDDDIHDDIDGDNGPNGSNGSNNADNVDEDSDTLGERGFGPSERSLENVRDHIDREEQDEEQDRVNLRVQDLTPREREILDLFVAGNSDDKIAGYLNTSAQSVQQSRTMITQKIGADSLPHLIRMIVRRELQDLTAFDADS